MAPTFVPNTARRIPNPKTNNKSTHQKMCALFLHTAHSPTPKQKKRREEKKKKNKKKREKEKRKRKDKTKREKGRKEQKRRTKKEPHQKVWFRDFDGGYAGV